MRVRLALPRKRDRRLTGDEHADLLSLLVQLRQAQLNAPVDDSSYRIRIPLAGRAPFDIPSNDSLLYIAAAFTAAIESAMRRSKMFEMS